MSRKIFFSILVLTIFLILGALLWWFFFLQKPTPGTTTPPKNTGFFPFGTSGQGGQTTSGNPGATTTAGGQQNIPLPQLRLISSVPVAGATTLTNPKTGETLIRYVERATGHIFETTAALPTLQRLTNTTIPKVEEALFVEDGSAVILRYLKDDTDTVESFYGAMTQKSAAGEGTTSEAQLLGTFLPENITGLSVSPDTKKIFYLTKEGPGSVGNITNPDGTKKAQIFASPVTEWLPSWPEQKTIALTTKPASGVPGYLYFLNTSSGALDVVLRKKLALTTLVHPTTRAVLFSDNDAGKNLSLHLSINTPDKKTSTLSLATFPEKCAWSQLSPDVLYCAVPKQGVQGEYPDLWYQGVASFADAIWKVNTKTGETTMLSGLDEEKNGKIDVVNLFLDKNEQFLFFTNKNDLKLWSLKITSGF